MQGGPTNGEGKRMPDLVSGGSKLCKLDPEIETVMDFVINVAEVVMRNSRLCVP